MGTRSPAGDSGPVHLPDYAQMRRSMLENARSHGVDGLPCPAIDCEGHLQVTDGEVTCETCGGPDDGRPAGLFL